MSELVLCTTGCIRFSLCSIRLLEIESGLTWRHVRQPELLRCHDEVNSQSESESTSSILLETSTMPLAAETETELRLIASPVLPGPQGCRSGSCEEKRHGPRASTPMSTRTLQGIGHTTSRRHPLVVTTAKEDNHIANLPVSRRQAEPRPQDARDWTQPLYTYTRVAPTELRAERCITNKVDLSF